MSSTPRSDATGSAVFRPMIVAGVLATHSPPSRTSAESSRRVSQDSTDGEIGSDAGGGASYLGRGSSQGQPLSPTDSWEKRLSLH